MNRHELSVERKNAKTFKAGAAGREGSDPNPGRSLLRGRWWAFVGIVTIGVTTWWLPQPTWTQLPNGREMRVLKMQYGEGVVSATFSPIRFKVLEPLSPFFDITSELLDIPALRSFWGRAVGPREVSKAYRVSEPRLIIWMLVRGRGAAPQLPYSKCWITLPDGQEFRTWCMHGDENGEESLYWIDLYEVPRGLKHLKLRLESEDGTESFPFEIENPAYLERRPDWKPEPFPQTRRVGNFEVTLTGITSRHVPMPAPNSTTWIADPHVEVRALEGERKEFYDFWTWIAGPEGEQGPAMFYQPCWKVMISISPRENHPQYGVAKPMVAEFFAKPPPPPSLK